MQASYYVVLAVIVAAVLVAYVYRQRGVRQGMDAGISAFGAKAHVKTSVDAEMEGIKAGRDVKAVAGEGDPARMKNVEAGRDVLRDTTDRTPKA
jgi:hypothetical protein